MKDLRNYFKQLDYVLIVVTALLALIGILMIASATKSTESSRQILVQSIAVGLGAVAMLVVAAVDYESYGEFEKYIYLASVVVLVLVLLFGQGKAETGANSWFRIGGISIQPSEFVKLAFCITFSNRLAKLFLPAASAAGKHISSIFVIASKSASEAVLILIIRRPSLRKRFALLQANLLIHFIHGVLRYSSTFS